MAPTFWVPVVELDSFVRYQGSKWSELLGSALTVLMKESINGFETASRCLINQGGRVLPTVTVAFVLSIMVSCSRFWSGSSTESRSEIGRESPW